MYVQAYQTPEQLDKDNEWYCSKCKEHVQATKKLDIWSLPEVRVLIDTHAAAVACKARLLWAVRLCWGVPRAHALSAALDRGEAGHCED